MTTSIRIFAVLFLFGSFFSISTYVSAQSGGAAMVGGKIRVHAVSSEFSTGTVTYLSVHAVTDTGTTLDADQMKFFLGSSGQMSTAVASGHVKAYVAQQTDGRSYTVTSETATYNPKLDQIDLAGHVKAVVLSKFTQGPLVQTGDTGTILLGKGKDFPKIIMRNVDTEFTPTQ